MFEATLRIIAIEQVIVDEAVTMVINHVPQYAADQLEGRIATFAERSLPCAPSHRADDNQPSLGRCHRDGRETWARLMTDQVLVLGLPQRDPSARA